MKKYAATVILQKLLPHRTSMPGGNQRGFGLVESLIAVGILGSTVTILLGGLMTGMVSVGILQEKITAENIARTQMEYTRSLSYRIAPYSYEAVSGIPEGYSVTAAASSLGGKDANIQKITVTVRLDGEDVYILEGFKVNR